VLQTVFSMSVFRCRYDKLPRTAGRLLATDPRLGVWRRATDVLKSVTFIFDTVVPIDQPGSRSCARHPGCGAAPFRTRRLLPVCVFWAS